MVSTTQQLRFYVKITVFRNTTPTRLIDTHHLRGDLCLSVQGSKASPNRRRSLQEPSHRFSLYETAGSHVGDYNYCYRICYIVQMGANLLGETNFTNLRVHFSTDT